MIIKCTGECEKCKFYNGAECVLGLKAFFEEEGEQE